MSFIDIHMAMKWTFLLAFVTFVVVQASDPDEFRLKPDEAVQFLSRARRSFLHPGKTKCEEQKREARKAYEEKCSFLGKRFCPKLTSWKDFQQWEIGGGYESKRNPLPTEPTTPAIQTMRTHRTRLYTQPTLPTHRTPLYGPVTRRSSYRAPGYGDETATRNPFD